MVFDLLLVVSGLSLLPQSWAQVIVEEVLSSVIFTTYGDRTPFILPVDPTLTPLGASQLYSVGAAFRDRYVSDLNGTNVFGTGISGLSPYVLDNSEITILSTTDQYIVASASAFMQGLYPPLDLIYSSTYETDMSILANGSNSNAPLNNYQYPSFYTAGPLDLNSIFIAGNENCPEYASGESQYFGSSQYISVLNANADFYASLVGPVFEGVFPTASVGYFDAYDLYDYAQYGVTHNSTIAEALSQEDLAKLRVLAAESQFAINGNTSSPGSIIAGRTLATRIMEALNANVNTYGAYNKLSLNFGSFEPMISFFALAGLPSNNPSNEQFYGLPELGSSMVIELFTLIVDDNSTDVYPDSSDLFVRFLYMNGTGDDAQLVQYPLFGADPDNMYMSFDDFNTAMIEIMMLSIEDWCQECGSYSVFCPAFDDSTTTGGSDVSSSSRHGLSPALAGVIGALVTLVMLALLIGLAMLVLGLRFFRVKNKRRSELAGFKGAEKLASDQDLTVPKGGAGAVITESGPAPGRGHERVGSWELRDSGKAEEAQLPIDRMTTPAPRRPSFEDDDLNVNPYSIPVKPKDQL